MSEKRRHHESVIRDNYLEMNSVGNLEFNRCDMVDLAGRFGTPLYVMNEDGVRAKCQTLKTHFMDRYPNTLALYASKAFSSVAMAKIMKEEGIGIDVVSGGELYTAIQAEFPREKIFFHGNNKSEEEITMALSYGVGRFVVDSQWEMKQLDAIAEVMNHKASVLLRISPGIDAHTHEYLQTGILDCKFGFPIEGGMALQAVEECLRYKNIEFCGVHCHIGSQIFTGEAYRDAVKVMTELILTIREKTGSICQDLNLGGGFGIRYTDKDAPLNVPDTLRMMMLEVESNCNQLGIQRPRVLIEPGRWIVGDNGITLYTVGAQKEIPGVRKYISVDGGMGDNPRPALYQAEYQGIVANRLMWEETQIATIAGKCCESGDILIRDARLPDVREGDILAVLSTGAYNYSMASNYNRLRKPAVVMIRDGEPRVVVKGETYDDIISNDAS